VLLFIAIYSSIDRTSFHGAGIPKAEPAAQGVPPVMLLK
jgi:hypothetical protein